MRRFLNQFTQEVFAVIADKSKCDSSDHKAEQNVCLEARHDRSERSTGRRCVLGIRNSHDKNSD